MIHVKNLTKKFSRNTVLDGLNFEIKQGEIVGLLGPNGAGKTTTLRILTGYLPFDNGEVEILGRDISDPKQCLEAKKQIGYLAENNPLYPEMLVCEYLRMIGQLKRMNPIGQTQSRKKNINNKIKEVVKKTGIETVYWRPISEISKGFKQRVGLAAAILNDPKILILDEPTEGLDPKQRINIRNLIKELGQDKTIIISSHVLQEIENTCDRIIIINQGKIVKDGKTSEILTRTENGNILIVEIEGHNVKERITNLVGEKNIISQSLKDGRFKLEIRTEKEIRPEISRLIREHNWVVWGMKLQETQLEDIFREVIGQ